MMAASISNDAERNGISASSGPARVASLRSTPAWARWAAWTIACTSAITRSCCSGVACTHSASSAASNDAIQGRHASRRASQTTITLPFRVGVLGGAVIGCRPTTSAREASMAATGAVLIEVTSSHKRPASLPAASSA